MTRHHGYVPWPSSTGALAPCRFCDMPAKHLIHAVPLDPPPWAQRAVDELTESDMYRRAVAAEARIAAAMEVMPECIAGGCHPNMPDQFTCGRCRVVRALESS